MVSTKKINKRKKTLDKLAFVDYNVNRRERKEGFAIILFLLFAMLLGAPDRKDPEATAKYKESEVKNMTMEEVKGKLLEKIDSMLEGADAEDVRKLAEAYSLLKKDDLLEQIAKNQNSMFSGIAHCEAGTTSEVKEG